MAWICDVVRGALLQENGAQGGDCARAGRREERKKEARVGWVEKAVGVGEIGVGGCGREGTSVDVGGASSGARRPR